MTAFLKKFIIFLLVGFISLSIGAFWLSRRYPATPAIVQSETRAISGKTGEGNGGAEAGRNAVKGFSRLDVAKHDSISDCWLIVHGEVYDVSSYVNNHPGGVSSITTRCGKAVSSIFASIHSNRAWNLLGKYRIGSIGTPARPEVAIGQTGKTVDVSTIAEHVASLFPEGEILKVEPFGSGYRALVVIGKRLQNLTLDAQGEVVSQEVQADEFEWFWQEDDEAEEYRREN